MKAVVFDFDGVIANSEPLHFRAFRDVLADEGITLSESEYYERYLGYNDERAFQEIGVERGRRLGFAFDCRPHRAQGARNR